MKPARNLSLILFIAGVALGIGGGLVYAWALNPVTSANVQPWQLNKQGQEAWIIAASIAYAQDGDLLAAANRLNDLRLNEGTFQRVADLACELARSSYAQTDAGLIAIRSMVLLAEGQGHRSCAGDLIAANPSVVPPTPTAARRTPTLAPVPTKTATPELGPTYTPATLAPAPPTGTQPSGKFVIARYEPFCSARESGVIEVLVLEANGQTGVRGAAVQVDWNGGRDRFFTGLKPERDDGYADFTMKPDLQYTVSLPGQSDTSSPLATQACTDKQTNSTALSSFRVYFRRSAK